MVKTKLEDSVTLIELEINELQENSIVCSISMNNTMLNSEDINKKIKNTIEAICSTYENLFDKKYTGYIFKISSRGYYKEGDSIDLDLNLDIVEELDNEDIIESINEILEISKDALITHIKNK